LTRAATQVRFFNNTAPRVGVELFFVQNAAFQMIPNVATSATTWVALDAVVAYVGYYGGPPVLFYTYTPATPNLRVLRTATLAVGGIFTLNGGAIGDQLLMNSGSDIVMYSGNVAVVSALLAAGAIPIINPNVNGAVITAYGTLVAYNEGFQKRVNLTGAGGLVSVWIPFKNMFLFCRAYNKISRGLRHRIVLNRQADNQMILRNTANADRFVQISYISAWIPRLKPNVDTLQMVETKLISNDLYTVNFTDLTVWRTSITQTGDASNSAIQLATTTKKPIRVWVAFQNVNRINDTQLINKRVFDNLGTTAIQVRLNGKIFPMYEYKFSTSTTNRVTTNVIGYNRAYTAFLNAGFKMDDCTCSDGSLIDINSYINLYPIFFFDLTCQEEDLYQTNKYAELEVRWSNQAGTAAPLGYHMWVVYESERVIKFKGVNSSMALEV